ncbi:DNA polymerase epsilon subunit [Cryptosporidium ryanae]|uniref:DNA polymerase epsilon subunit n=1 Tax=Cryptosporidium ryanae TaxID=515981 RepID=UPI003519F51E|nr:DNA polymerase epsilon subunit [Cryptosporidium ryanae]
MNDLYIHSVYDPDNWSKLSNNNILKNAGEKFEKRSDSKKTNLFTTASSFRQSYLLRYYFLKNSLVQHSSFTFHNSDNLDVEETILNKYGDNIVDFSQEIDIDKSKFVIYSIKSLLGTSKKATLFGMLIKNEDGELLLEDPTYKIKLEININSTLFGKGIYCLNHIVVVRGKMNSLSGNFEVEFLFHPPIQNIDDNMSRHILDKSLSLVMNTCSISEKEQITYESKIISPCLNKMNIKYSKFNETDISKNSSERIETWIVISDLLLMSNKVMTNLEKVFSGYEQLICGSETKLGFILLGNFVVGNEYFSEKTKDIEEIQNKEFNLMDMGNNKTNKLFLSLETENKRENSNSLLSFEKTRKHFDELKKLLNKFQTLKNNCIFLIIPGPNDIGPDLLPKNPLADYFTSNITQEFPNNIYLKSSPSRLYDNGNSIFIMRHSLSVELREKTIYSYFGEDNMGHSKYWNLDSKVLEQIIPPTILGQKHITPTSSNIIPTLDSSFYLLPIPNIIIIGDPGPSYSVKPVDNVWIVNPGSFKNTSSWIQYNITSNSIDHVWL